MTAAKDHKNSELSFKSASLDQIWSCLQRCLLFEEPSSRWTKLISQVSRSVNGKARDLSKLPLSQQQDAFKTVYGTPDDLLDVPARFFNLILAMHDLRQFESADFDLWFLSQSDEEHTESNRVFFEIARKVLDGEPTTSQIACLTQAWNVVPYWRVLESFGPWANDPLSDFVATFMNRLDRMNLHLNAAAAMSAYGEFERRLREVRQKVPANFLPSVLVLVEGNTESILLPRFLALSGLKQTDPAVTFVSCGGAKQVLRKYLQMRDLTRLPILCVIDQDAVEQIETIEQVLRDGDRMHIWNAGEIEDTFPKDSILDHLNHYLKSLGATELLLSADLQTAGKRTEQLNRLWRNRGLGDFDKVGFAEFLLTRLRNSSDLPPEGRTLMSLIKNMATGKHGAS